MSEPDLDLEFVDAAVEKIGRGPDATIPILQAIQAHYRYVPEQALRRVCEITDIDPAAIVGVATFYSQFRMRPAGEHTIRVCIGTACHVKGGEDIYEAFREHLGIGEGEDTDAERQFTVEKVACLGCCMLAPAVEIGNMTYGHLTPETVGAVVDDFLASQAEAAGERGAAPGAGERRAVGEVRISLDTCCIASGAGKVARALGQAIRRTGAAAVLKAVGCAGKSYLEPLVEVISPGAEPVLYQAVCPDDAEAIVRRHFRPAGLGRRVRSAVSSALEKALTDEAWDAGGDALPPHHPSVQAFDEKQVRIATEYCGQASPTDLDEYLRHDGFAALRRCLEELTPQQVIDEIAASRLRGRGGAGYPTAAKWAQVADQPGPAKYLVCNGDEGDPGAFMDRMLLESQPYRIIEGLTIAAYAVAAHAGYAYIRAEYPRAVIRMTEAIERCRKAGFLGKDIMGSGLAFELHIMEGAGAFVCGEETALLASMEGRRGEPRLRPPYPAASGLWGKPTLVNNTETFSLVPWIIRNGGAAFAALGDENSRGTKVFALAGKVARGGLIEVPMGITLRQIVEDIGGGVSDGERLKAVQVGGPSGGCVPERLADTPVDYEALTGAGAMMGSGGLVVLDETDCMVEIARYFLQFTQDESCGKCTACRVGTRRMLEVLQRLCDGQGRRGDVEHLEHLARTIEAGSLCGLGRSAPNPVLTTIKYFRDEYDAHIEGRCPAASCKALITYSITDDCIGCTICAQHCPADAIAMRPYEKHEIDNDKCVRCGTCKQGCPADAVKVE